MTTLQTESLTLSRCGAYWHYAPDEVQIEAMMRENGLSRELSACCALIGLSAGDEVASFLSPSAKDFHDPMLMLGMERAVERFRRAILDKEPILVVTDYDVDGTMSSLILQAVLKICGHSLVSFHIPDRQDEGYGFSMKAAEKAAADGIRLIVTADIGVRDEASIAHAKSCGIDVIVLDHHLPPGAGVPASAYAVLCPPQAGCSYPNKALAACGISFKFAQAMLKEHPKYEGLLRSLAKLACLGTVADIVSLRERENREIVTLGLDALNHDAHKPGVEALLNVSRMSRGTISSSDIGYSIGPRINAAGRLASATLIIDLIQANNRVQAQGLAAKLDAMNGDRQRIQEAMVARAVAEVGDSNAPFVVVALPVSADWHSGVSGIVAGRLKELLHRPVAVATIEGDMMTGSVRSTPGIHAVKALTSVSQYLTKYGGHAAAAGFSGPAESLEAFCVGLWENAMQQLNGDVETQVTDVALCLQPAEVTFELFEDLSRLEPCGCQNNTPLICLKNVRFRDVRVLKEKHLSACVIDTPCDLKCLWFSAPMTAAEMAEGEFHVVGELKREVWNGRVQHKLLIRDICMSHEHVFV